MFYFITKHFLIKWTCLTFIFRESEFKKHWLCLWYKYSINQCTNDYEIIHQVDNFYQHKLINTIDKTIKPVKSNNVTTFTCKTKSKHI